MYFNCLKLMKSISICLFDKISVKIMCTLLYIGNVKRQAMYYFIYFGKTLPVFISSGQKQDDTRLSGEN